jgi:protein SCO1/2
MRRFLAVALWVALAGCRREAPLPVYWQVPAFQLTSQSGQPFDSKSLEGDIWVADFIFTTCPGPCPRMSSQMRGVQTAIASMPGVKLVSFTVDPKNDTPAALAAYATRYRAEPGRWFFLTGDQAALENLCRNGFKLGDVDGSLVHSTRFVLVDGHSRVRGFYSTAEDGAVPKLLHDIRTLVGEKDGGRALAGAGLEPRSFSVAAGGTEVPRRLKSALQEQY